MTGAGHDVTNPDRAGDVAGRKRSSWHQRASAYVAELQAELDRIEARGNLPEEPLRLLIKAQVQLKAAREALDSRDTPLAMISGSTTDRAWSNIHRAELSMLKLATEKDLTWWGTEVLARTKQHLGTDDPIRNELESHVGVNGKRLDGQLRDLAVRALRAANDAQDLERSRLRSFRNILLTSVLLASLVAGLLALWGYVDPEAIASNLCFLSPPPGRTFFCPIGNTPGGDDILIVEFFGLCGAVLAGAISLRKMQGTATPFMVPICLLLLRLPIGALAAVFGLVVIKGGFVPGFSNLDNQAQALAWALAFGIAQESITRLIDEQGKKVMGNVRGPSRGFDEEAPENSSHSTVTEVKKLRRKPDWRHALNRGR